MITRCLPFANSGVLVQIVVALFFWGNLTAQPGQIDASFQVGTGASHVVNRIEILPNGKIFLGGEFTIFNTLPVQRAAFLHPNGSHDQTYATYASGGFEGPVRSSNLQPDGKLLVGGLFNTVNGLVRKNIVRLDTTGAVDPGFVTGTGASNEVLGIASTANRIILSGFFNQFNGQTAPGLVCLHPSGAIDTSFLLPPSWVSISALHLLPNNQLYLAGNFTSYLGVPVGRIVRLLPNGQIDTAFNAGAGFSALVQSMAVQPDGKILAGGAFSTFAGVSRVRIARINPDGSLDTTFNPGSGASGGVRMITLQSDGKIIIAGDFATYNGVTVNRIARLNTDGSLDTTFNTMFNGVSGSNGSIMNVKVQADGRVIVGGGFSQFAGSPVARVVRLINDVCLSDNILPVPDVPQLPALAGLCEVQVVNVPTATDNCAGAITGTTNDPLYYDTPGSYQITWHYDDGNGNIASQTQHVVVAGIDTSVNADTLVPGQSYKLTAVYGGAAVQYHWVDCSNQYQPVPGASQKDFFPVLSGTYAVIIEDQGCIDTSACIQVVINPIGVEKMPEFSDFSVFPNPSNGNITIASGITMEDASVLLFNQTGEIVYRASSITGAEHKVDLIDIAPGLYFLEIRMGQSSVKKKVVILF